MSTSDYVGGDGDVWHNYSIDPVPIDICFSVSKHRILHTQDMYLKSTLPTRNNFTEGRRFT